MGKISPIFNKKDSLYLNSVFDYTEADIKDVKVLKNDFFEHALYDSFNFLNSNMISNIATAISNSKCINIVYENNYNRINEFINQLLKLGFYVNIVNSEKSSLDLFYIHIDVNEKGETNVKLVLEKDYVKISNKKNSKGSDLLWARSSLDVPLEKKLKIFFDCIYMNILARKVL